MTTDPPHRSSSQAGLQSFMPHARVPPPGRPTARPGRALVERLAYSPREFAEATGLSITTVYQLVKAGELPARVLNPASEKPRYLIAREAADAWFRGLDPA